MNRGRPSASAPLVPPLTRTIGLPDMVAYAGATWDWHRMHYDTGYLTASTAARRRSSTGRCWARCSPRPCRTGSARARSCAACGSASRPGVTPARSSAARAKVTEAAAEHDRAVALQVVVRRRSRAGVAVSPRVLSWDSGRERRDRRRRRVRSRRHRLLDPRPAGAGDHPCARRRRPGVGAMWMVSPRPECDGSPRPRSPNTSASTWRGASRRSPADRAFEMYVARAAQAIESGQCETVVISYASNQRSARSRSLAGACSTRTPEAQFQAPYGPLYPISLLRDGGPALSVRDGASREQLAEVAVAAREWALLNPRRLPLRRGTADRRRRARRPDGLHRR